MLDRNVKSDVIEAYVKLFEDYAKTSDLEGIYDDTTAKVQGIDLKGITGQNMEKVIEYIRRCLFEWGGMGRVLGRQKYKGLEEKLKDLVREYSSTLDNFRKV